METTTTRRQRMKTWIKNHTDEIAIGALCTAIAAVYAAAIVAAVKQQKIDLANSAENQSKLMDAIDRNDFSIVSFNDDVWIVPNELIHSPSA